MAGLHQAMLDDTRKSHALMQDPAFAQALRACGQNPVHLPCGLIILQQRFAALRVCMLPRAAPPSDLPDQLRTIGLHRTPLILSPDRPTTLPRSLKLRAPCAFAILDLTSGSDAMRRALHPKWRNQLVVAEKTGPAVTRHRLAPDIRGHVLSTATQQAKTRGYASWPAQLTAAFAHVAPDQTCVFRATHQSTEVAHMLFLTHGDHVTYHHGHITEAGKKLCAHNLLMWHAMRHFSNNGYSEIDLGIIDGRTPGLDRFKTRTGAALRSTGGTYLYWRPMARG